MRAALLRTYDHVDDHHTMQMAAALSYYFVLSLFPALILLSALVAYLPVPDLFNQALDLMARFVPADSMGIIRGVLADVITPYRGSFLSLGVLGTIWAASGGFVAAMEALNIAYDVQELRSFWRRRAMAIFLSVLIAGLLLSALAVMIFGPRFGAWIAARIHLSAVFGAVWPYLHWTISVAFTVLAVEVLYYFGPNVKQRFLATLPGAVLSVTIWVALSYLLSLYFRHFAAFNKTYGTLGATVALMVWLYWTSFVMLVGAELNAELAQESKEGRVPEAEEPPTVTTLKLSA